MKNFLILFTISASVLISSCSSYDYKQELTTAPQGWNALFENAKAYAKKFDWNAAISEMDKAVALNKNYADSYAHRSNFKRNARNYQGALEDISIAISLSPQTPDYYYARMKLNAIYIKDVKNLEKDCDFVCEKFPSAKTYSMCGYVCTRYFNYSSKYAVDYYDLAIESDPNDISNYEWRALNLYNLSKFKAALDDLNKVLSVKKDNPKTYALRGETNFMLGRVNQAIADFNTAIQKGDNSKRTAKLLKQAKSAL